MGRYHSKKKVAEGDRVSHDVTVQCGHMAEGA